MKQANYRAMVTRSKITRFFVDWILDYSWATILTRKIAIDKEKEAIVYGKREYRKKDIDKVCKTDVDCLEFMDRYNKKTYFLIYDKMDEIIKEMTAMGIEVEKEKI